MAANQEELGLSSLSLAELQDGMFESQNSAELLGALYRIINTETAEAASRRNAVARSVGPHLRLAHEYRNELLRRNFNAKPWAANDLLETIVQAADENNEDPFVPLAGSTNQSEDPSATDPATAFTESDAIRAHGIGIEL